MYNNYKQVHIGNEMRVRIWGCSGAKGDSISTLKRPQLFCGLFLYDKIMNSQNGGVL